MSTIARSSIRIILLTVSLLSSYAHGQLQIVITQGVDNPVQIAVVPFDWNGFGILDEGHQLYVPGRYASLTDIALNSLGAAFAVWLLSRPVRTTRQFSP